MKKLTLIGACLLATGAVMAESPTTDNTATLQFAEAKSRAQVQAELAHAKADGSIRVFLAPTDLPLTVKPSAVSRAEVVAELEAARASGALAAFNGEDGGSTYLAKTTAPRAQAPVFATVN